MGYDGEEYDDNVSILILLDYLFLFDNFAILYNEPEDVSILILLDYLFLSV